MPFNKLYSFVFLIFLKNKAFFFWSDIMWYTVLLYSSGDLLGLKQEKGKNGTQMANSGPDDNHTDTTQKPLGAIWCSLFWTCNWSWGFNLRNQSCPKGTYCTSVKVVLRICGSQASHYFHYSLSLSLSSFLYTLTFLFPVCVMSSPFFHSLIILNSFPLSVGPHSLHSFHISSSKRNVKQ